MIPIFNGGDTTDPRKRVRKVLEIIFYQAKEENPKRPDAQRSGPVPNQNYQEPQNNGAAGNNSAFPNFFRHRGLSHGLNCNVFFFGFGILPMLISLVSL